MLGNGVKVSEFLTDHDKSYIAELVRYKTDTGDVTGNIIENRRFHFPPLKR